MPLGPEDTEYCFALLYTSGANSEKNAWTALRVLHNRGVALPPAYCRMPRDWFDELADWFQSCNSLHHFEIVKHGASVADWGERYLIVVFYDIPTATLFKLKFIDLGVKEYERGA